MTNEDIGSAQAMAPALQALKQIDLDIVTYARAAAGSCPEAGANKLSFTTPLRKQGDLRRFILRAATNAHFSLREEFKPKRAINLPLGATDKVVKEIRTFLSA